MSKFNDGDWVYLPKPMFTGRVLGTVRDLEGKMLVLVQSPERGEDGKLPMMFGDEDAWRMYWPILVLVPSKY